MISFLASCFLLYLLTIESFFSLFCVKRWTFWHPASHRMVTIFRLSYYKYLQSKFDCLHFICFILIEIINITSDKLTFEKIQWIVKKVKSITLAMYLHFFSMRKSEYILLQLLNCNFANNTNPEVWLNYKPRIGSLKWVMCGLPKFCQQSHLNCIVNFVIGLFEL